jgi:pimeloyl-ACP methyl ester carboxylesterase
VRKEEASVFPFAGKISAVLIVAACLGCGSAPSEQAASPPEKQAGPQLDPELQVTITSSADGSAQPAIFWLPPGAAAQETGPRVPLVVFLHSWSTDLMTSGPALEQSQKRGWIFAGPNFRGPNNQPEACASDLAVQDVLDSVNYAKQHARVDEDRVYLVGGSGGGFMALLMAARAPQAWDRVSAWVPITDLAAWHAFSRQQGNQYAGMMEACFGGAPDTPARVAEYGRRSPLFILAQAKGIPIAIDSGLRDGHDGASVPLSHTLRAFNELAKANGHDDKMLSEEDIQTLTQEARIPEHLAGEKEEEAGREHAVLFRRYAGPVRVTVFDGGHSVDIQAAFQWLEASDAARSR